MLMQDNIHYCAYSKQFNNKQIKKNTPVMTNCVNMNKSLSLNKVLM